MAFFPHVNPGDPVKPSTSLENNVRDMINRFNATGELPVSRGSANSYRLQCWNNNDYVIPAGASVEIVEDAEWLSNGVPAIKFAATDATVWGVTEAAITPGSIGSVLFGGIVYLNGSVSVGRYVRPDGNGGYRYSDGGCLIIGQTNSSSIAMLGQQSTAEFPHMFDIKLEERVAEDGSGRIFAVISNPPKTIRLWNETFYFSDITILNTEIDVTDVLVSGNSTGIYLRFYGYSSESRFLRTFAYVTDIKSLTKGSLRPYIQIARIYSDGRIVYNLDYSNQLNYGTTSNDRFIVPLYDAGTLGVGVILQKSWIYPKPESITPESDKWCIWFDDDNTEYNYVSVHLVPNEDGTTYHADIYLVQGGDDSGVPSNEMSFDYYRYDVASYPDEFFNFFNRYFL